MANNLQLCGILFTLRHLEDLGSWLVARARSRWP
jgi:hypothetical protein